MNLNSKKLQNIFIIVSFILLAIALRTMFIFIQTPDLTKFVFTWYDTLYKVGRIDALRINFYNYTPSYIYLIDIMTLFPWIGKLAAIKIISMVFDFFAAAAVYQLVGIKTTRLFYKWIGFFALLFLPTVIIESSVWGQVDIIYTAFLLWSLFFILKSKPGLAVLSFSIGFCFKLQAVFFLPIFLILFLHKKIIFSWFFLIPFTYFISILPCLVLGRSLTDLLSIYFQQIDVYHSLTMRAPNIYTFIQAGDNFNLIVRVGYGLTAAVILSYILLRWLKWKKINAESICFDAAFFTIIVPYLLPKMHERYFFTGGIFLLILTLLFRKQILSTILIQVSLMLSFIPYFTGWSNNWVTIAAIINIFVLFFFFYYGKEQLFDTNSKLADSNPQMVK